MVKTKKMLGIVLASMLVVASMITSFAASNQDVLLALQEGVTISTGDSIYPSVEDMQVAKNYLAEKNLSSSDLDTVLNDIKTVQRTASTVSSLEELAKNADVTNAVNNAARVAGVKVSLDSGNITVTDPAGKSLLSINKDSVSKKKPDYSAINGTSNTDTESSGSSLGNNINNGSASSTTSNKADSSAAANSVKESGASASTRTASTGAIKQTGASASTRTASTGAIKQTGAEVDLTNMAVAVSLTVLMLAGAGFAAYKFNLLRD